MSRPPRLSIVIPSHRRTDLLQACLAALARWAPPDAQILVIDDGSPDAAVSRIAAMFANVNVCRFDKPRGFCAAANLGIRAATAPIVELLNDDAEVTPGWFEPALEAFADP